MGTTIGIYLKEMRIKSWLKNVFVFFPIVFSLELFEWNKLIEAIILFLAFCFISSAIYVLNDICDVENDRKHEVKKFLYLMFSVIFNITNIIQYINRRRYKTKSQEKNNSLN